VSSSTIGKKKKPLARGNVKAFNTKDTEDAKVREVTERRTRPSEQGGGGWFNLILKPET